MDRTREHVTETVLLLGLAAFTALALLPGHGFPVWALWSGEMITGAVAALSIWAQTGSSWLSGYALAFGMFLSLWTVHSAGRLWHVPAIFIWIIGMIVMVPLGVHACRKAQVPVPVPVPPRELDAPDLAAEERAKWDHLFTQIGCEGVRTVRVAQERAGRVVRLELPREGRIITLEHLQGCCPAIETILHLRQGAAEFEIGDHRGDIILRLRERDVLSGTVLLQREHLAGTITKPFAIGVQEDGTLGMISLREMHGMLTGMTGAGKSNLINVIITQLTGMVDTLVWVIDMKGGRVAKPWLQPWIEGKAQRPALDWVATTREEAALMMNAFIAAINVRMNSGIGGSKITPSAALPQILLITDEMADLFGSLRGGRSVVGEGATTNGSFIRLAEELTQKARSEAGTSLWASQRATNSMAGSGDLKANCKLRIILGTANQTEARYANNDNRTAQKRAAGMIDLPGGGVITMGGKSSLPTKFFRHDHPDKPGTETGESLCDNGCVPSCPVYQSALNCAAVRPTMDRMTASAVDGEMDGAYAKRWERASTLLRRPIPSVGTMVQEDTSTFEEIIAGGGFADPEANLHPGHKRMRELLAARGPMGGTPGYLLKQLEKEGHTVARETVQRWLREDSDEGILHSAEEFGRWKSGPKAA